MKLSPCFILWKGLIKAEKVNRKLNVFVKRG